MFHEYELVGSETGDSGIIADPNMVNLREPGHYTSSRIVKLFISEINKGEFKLRYARYMSGGTFEGNLTHKYYRKIDYDVLQAILNGFIDGGGGYGKSFRFTDLNRDTYFFCQREEMPIMVMEYIMKKSNQTLMETWEG